MGFSALRWVMCYVVQFCHEMKASPADIDRSGKVEQDEFESIFETLCK